MNENRVDPSRATTAGHFEPGKHISLFFGLNSRCAKISYKNQIIIFWQT